MITFIKTTETDIETISSHNNLSLSDIHTVENCNSLISKNFSITEKNGFSTINGTIENISEQNIDTANCHYILYDGSNNIVYEFEISISNLNTHNSTSYSSICATNLSNITNYSVTLAE